MKLKRIISLFICCLFFITVSTGCSDHSEESTEKSNKPEIKAGEIAKNCDGTYPMKITDCRGYEVNINRKPEKILSTTLGSDEMLLSLVDKSSITALSGKISEDDGISNVADQAKGYDKAESNVEKIISMQPDIVFCASWVAKTYVQQLKDAGLTVYCHQTPGSIDEAKNVIMDIATILGVRENGIKVCSEMDAKMKTIDEKVSQIIPEEKLSVLIYYTSLGSTSSTGSSFDDIARRAGVINAAAVAKLDTYAVISKEKIIELNPDVILLPYWHNVNKKSPEQFLENFMSDQSFANTKAIKNHQVYLIPDKHISCVSQYMVYGVEDVAKTVYPELFQ